MDLLVAIRKLCSVSEGSVGLGMGLWGVDDDIRVQGARWTRDYYVITALKGFLSFSRPELWEA